MLERIYIKAGGTGAHWTRPPEWPALPAINPGDGKFYGIFAVYPDLVNDLTVKFTTTNNVAVDWGDGTAPSSVPTGTDTTHTYDYASIVGNVLTDRWGYSYKAVTVAMTFDQTTTVDVSRASANVLTAMVPWLDIVIDNANMIDFAISTQRNPYLLERFRVLQHNLSGVIWFGKSNCHALRVMDVDFSGCTNWSTLLQYTGDMRADESGTPFTGYAGDSTTLSNVFNYSAITAIGDITADATCTSARRMFIGCYDLAVVGTVDVRGVPDLSQMFYECRALRKISLITSAATTNLETMFRFCHNLEEVEFSDCSGVTDTTTMFIYTASLRSLIMPGLTVGLDISGNNMSADALNAFFTAAGNANGVQNFNVSNNPGAATCDTSIATAKGYTVTTA